MNAIRTAFAFTLAVLSSPALAAEPKVVRTPSGIEITTLTEGTGASPRLTRTSFIAWNASFVFSIRMARPPTLSI